MANLSIKRSEEMFSRGLKVLPAGVVMFNKRPLTFTPSPYPIYAEKTIRSLFLERWWERAYRLYEKGVNFEFP